MYVPSSLVSTCYDYLYVGPPTKSFKLAKFEVLADRTKYSDPSGGTAMYVLGPSLTMLRLLVCGTVVVQLQRYRCTCNEQL
jgi:hypothetical protein